MNNALFKRAEEVLQKGVKSSIGRNIFSLYLLQFANYLLPLVTVPYLVRVLGPERFGAVAFGRSLIAYFVLLVNYGFDWSATRKISVQREDLKVVSRTATAVWTVKAMLCVAGFLLFWGLVSVVPRFQKSSALLLILYGIVVGNAFFPTWLFQGMERMVAISVINLTVRVLSTAGVFALVHKPADFIVYAALLALQWISIGLLGLLWACQDFEISLVWPGWSEVRGAFVEGWTLFLSKGAINLYTAGNALILGFFANNTVVGYYSAAEKLVRAAQMLLRPISQAVYPRFSKMADNSKLDALKWARIMLFSMGGAGFLLSLFIFIRAPLVVRVVLGPGYEPSVRIVRILAILPFLIAISNVFGVQLMFPFHRDRDVMRLTFVAGFVNLLLSILLTPLYQASGMAIAVAASEIFVSLSYMVCCHLNNLNPFFISEE